jgi:translation initiation factor IF-3
VKEGFIATANIRVNERIRAREVRVIEDNGTQLGIMPPQQALKIAREQQLDLVEVSPTAVPPVCKIMDYGKYVYQLNKRAHEAKKNQRNIVVKEVKFRPTTDDHDYEFKKNSIVRFLKDGDKVKAIVTFRGREISHAEIGRKLMDRLIADVGDAGTVEFRPHMEGFSLTAVLAPKK